MYEPTIDDCIKIYEEYNENKGELAATLSDIFGCLSQEPIKSELPKGYLYLRAEVDAEEVLCIHYIYADRDENIITESKYIDEEDITIYSLREQLNTVKKIGK